MIPKQDYYTILGVSRDSEENEIKKAYYKLCLKWHPDKNKSPGAEDKFKEINKAYETLSDTNKRSLYDLQSDYDGEMKSSRSNTNFKPSKSENYTFNDSNYDETNTKWNQFNNNESAYATNTNGGSYRKNFYKQYRKYFDSGFFFNVESDDESYDNYNNNNNNSNNSNDYENDFEADSATTDDFNSNKTQNNQNGYKYHASSGEPFDLFETFECFRLYRLFSEMSSRLFEDVNDEEMLINLAKIISSFSMPETAKSKQQQQHQSGNTNNDDSKFNYSRETQSPHLKSDFVYEAKTATKSDETKLPKMSNSNNIKRNNESQMSNNKKNWEFEWLGKSSDSKKSESPVNVDDEDIDDSSETSASPYECFYCSKQLNDRESLDKHQSICKRLSHNKTSTKYNKKNNLINNKFKFNETSSSPNNSSFSSSTSSSPLTTECPKCKITFNTYDFLLHQCSNRINKPQASYKSKTTSNNNSQTQQLQQPVYKPFVHHNSTRFKDLISNNKTANPSAFKPVNSRFNDDTNKHKSSSTSSTPASSSSFANSDFVFSKIKSKPNVSHSSQSPKRSSRISMISENGPKYNASSSMSTPNRSIYTNTTNIKTKPTDHTKLNGSLSDRDYSKTFATTGTTTSTPNTFKSYASFSKPISPLVNPNYSNVKLANRSSKSSAAFTNQNSNKFSSFNALNTGLKREKLRTGF